MESVKYYYCPFENRIVRIGVRDSTQSILTMEPFSRKLTPRKLHKSEVECAMAIERSASLRLSDLQKQLREAVDEHIKAINLLTETLQNNAHGKA